MIQYLRNNSIALGFIVALIAAVWAIAQTTTLITNPDGSTTAVIWTPPPTGPTTNPVTPPPTGVTPVPGATTSAAPPAAGYVAAIGEFLDGLGLPGIKGQSYASTLWITALLANGHDANGFVDLSPYITAAGNAGRLAYVSPAALSWPSLAKATRFGDFNGAVQSGDSMILIPDGQTYPLAVWDNNLENSTGTATNPKIICRIGPNGFLDHSAGPRPICQGGFGLNDPRSGHPASAYVIVDGLDFQGTNPPTQQQCLGFLDSNSGTPSTHILCEDCRFEHFITGTNLQSGAAYPLQTVIFRRCVWEHCYGAFYGEYHFHVQDFLMVDCVLAYCGWDAQFAPKWDQQGREHDQYVGMNPTAETNDPQHRVIDTIYATPDSEGVEGDCGGEWDTDLWLACPIGGYGAAYQSLFNNCVVDGDNVEFDPSTTCGTNSGTYTITQSGKVGDALSLGPCGAPGNLTGFERGWGLYFDCCPKGTMENCLFIDKPDGVNSGPAIQICLQDNAKGLPSTSSNVTFNNVKIHNWYDWPNVTSGAGPCPVSVSGTTSTLSATISYADCVFPGVSGVSGVSGVEPNYVDPTRTVSAYAKTLGIPGVVDGPSFLAAAENNWSGNWNPALTAAAAIEWIQAGFVVKGN
jgi:hypothetical protein